MKPLKFRAWDSKNKVMTIAREMNDWLDAFAQAEYDSRTNFNDKVKSWVWLQFTGLKDKDGKEIYEGDIVQRGVIMFERGKFQGFYHESNGSIAENWEDDLYQDRNIKVLGNMYENPELLCDEKF